ncbi:low molecular weight phosphatase family protein [Pseudarthrobacter sp. P1]|uniref:arsenate reductase/protein-tyrosine-phosphatase family protein n=1 Tax=Pseudarthrobacter sp. P1 TaxID=3418418 RepID=UPI003CF4D7A3
MTADAPFRILVVCTGNICRSPMAERLLAAGLDKLAPRQFAITSAGTQAMVDWNMVPQVQGLLRVFGADPEHFAARLLTPQILKDQDLVLTMTRAHRSRVVELAPSLLLKTFTLRELARLLPGVQVDAPTPAERWRAALRPAARLRSRAPGSPGDDDVVDPYGRGDATYQEMSHQLAPAVRTLLSWEATSQLHSHGI